jgi:hypothetical protein
MFQSPDVVFAIEPMVPHSRRFLNEPCHMRIFDPVPFYADAVGHLSNAEELVVQVSSLSINRDHLI